MFPTQLVMVLYWTSWYISRCAHSQKEHYPISFTDGVITFLLGSLKTITHFWIVAKYRQRECGWTNGRGQLDQRVKTNTRISGTINHLLQVLWQTVQLAYALNSQGLTYITWSLTFVRLTYCSQLQLYLTAITLFFAVFSRCCLRMKYQSFALPGSSVVWAFHSDSEKGVRGHPIEFFLDRDSLELAILEKVCFYIAPPRLIVGPT